MENNIILDVAYDHVKLEASRQASEKNVKEIIRLLKQQNLNKNVNIKYEDIKLDINFNSLSKYNPSQKVRRFDMDDDTNSIRYEDKLVMLYMYIGSWSTNARIKNSHLSIYTNSSKIGGERFFQIELSDCIEDDDYVYILKNISKNAGNGAIARLNKYSYSTSEREKRDMDLRARREELVRRTYSEVINFDNNDWVCIYKFDKEKLLDSSYHEELFNECIERIIEFTFAVESIVVEYKKFGSFIPVIPMAEKLSKKTLLKKIQKVNKKPKKIEATQTSYIRNEYITEYAKRRADGVCQLCMEQAPFKDKNNKPYLEVHHIVPLSQYGEDSIENTVALCPNCHRKMHSLENEEDIKFLKYVASIEYIEIYEISGIVWTPTYRIKVLNNGRVKYSVIGEDEPINKSWCLNKSKLNKFINEISEFGLKDFQLKETMFITCHPKFCIEIKYTDGTKQEINYNYGATYENTLGNNQIDILKLKSNLEKILKIKSYM